MEDNLSPEEIEYFEREEGIARVGALTHLKDPCQVTVLYFDGVPISAATFSGLSIPLSAVKFGNGIPFAPYSVVSQIVIKHLLAKLKNQGTHEH